MRWKNHEPLIFSKFGKASTGLPRLPGARWYVCRVKSRRTKILGHELAARRMSFFLPMQPAKNGRRGMDLLLPGLIFLLGFSEDLHAAYETRRMCGQIPTKDTKALKLDLEAFAAFTKHLNFCGLDKIKPGVEVRIARNHPIKAIRGTTALVDLRRGNRVWLNLPMIGAASFEIEAQYLEVR